MRIEVPQFTIPTSLRKVLYVCMGFGLLVFIAGLFLKPDRIWPNYLIAEFYLLSLGLGAALFVAVLYVTNAGWAAAIRRIPEAMSSVLVVAAIGVPVLIFGIHTLYEWSHESVVLQDTVLLEKSAWLNEPFFVGRLVFYFIVWILLSRILVKNSFKQDTDGDVKYTFKNVRISAVFLIVGAVTFSLASIDLIMSLQPHWYSTVFAMFTIAGMITSSLAAITVLLIILRRFGLKHIFTTEHLVDLGNLLLAFSVFWVYIWVSQHLLIWYSNIPEETSYYIFRHFGGWGSLSFLNVVLNWLIPFLVLLPRAARRSDKVMLQVAIVLLVAHWLDLYIMVMPATLGAEPTLGAWEIGLFVGVLGLFFWVVLRRLQSVQLVPANDPYLVESLPGGEEAGVVE